ncbi:uncharacterized protein KY384_001333 [Bacidia gigantensis]|uniref:uncharacterized protein n=1 Tax=Bacidia gigantensis TaxID=2732470 RepID=UPI001D036E43|nr:uncharacterized protein KY384_001333 [Bacidia gigantensis]KAG8533593.1 hypothetical protein KY384_001333 [Bacidia gigantensis]
MASHTPGDWPSPEPPSPESQLSEKPSVKEATDDDPPSTTESESTDEVQSDHHELDSTSLDTKGKGKAAVKNRHRVLPAEILESILYLVDPETFASLILVDHAWREASQTPHLYAHQLSRCPSYAFNNLVADAGPFTEDSLPNLKNKFAQEVKRNLFEVFLHPKRTVISLVSTTTTSSSAAFPSGEAFDFAFSPNGRWTLALSSSRIYLLDTGSALISVVRELKVFRRPIAAAILDDGSTLAVISSSHANLYSISNQTTKHVRSISLGSVPHALALTPKGEVLAVAFEGGVELYSLATSASEVDRRSVKCDWVDNLTFNNDGTVLLGTTRNNRNSYTVVLTAPYYAEDNQDLPVAEQISHIWTSQIIFPNSSRDCSHAALLSNRSDGDATWTFTFDRVFESFRAVRTDDLRNGTTYFTGPKRPRRKNSNPSRKHLAPCTLPTASHTGDLVATGFLGKDIWLYGVPQGLDVPVMSQGEDPNSASGPQTPASAPRSPIRSSSRGEASHRRDLPNWDVLVDKYKNVFAKGRRVVEIPGATGLSWVEQNHQHDSTSLQERLIVAAPGGVVGGDVDLEQDVFAFVDGGRLIILDFDRRSGDGGVEELTFEVGTETPETLEEEEIDLEVEVEIARRRTRRGPRPVMTIVDALAPSPEVPPLPPTANAIANMRTQTRGPQAIVRPLAIPNTMAAPKNDSPTLSPEEASEAFDGPYSPDHPRSRTSLYRSATAVAAERERNPPRIVDEARIEYRRANGRGELPHESDADNWVPPPPPYAPNADRPLPEHLLKSLQPLPKSQSTLPKLRSGRPKPQRANTMYENAASRRISSLAERRSAASRPQMTISSRSVTESLDQLSGPVSPVSTNYTVGNNSDPDISRTSTTMSKRRPMSAYVGRMATSIRRRSNPRLRPDSSEEVVPPSHRPVSPMTRQGSDSPPQISSSAPQIPLPDLPAIPSMPSAEQLANLENRFRQAPSPNQGRHRPPSLIASGDRIPAPPPGALGAAGSPSRRPSREGMPGLMAGSNPGAVRSSPSLLRPAAQRLHTIDSISSKQSRSKSRSGSRGLQSAGSAGAPKRSQSFGPALRLDRLSAGAGGERRGFMGMKKRGRKGKGGDGVGDSEEGGGGDGEGEKDGKCVVM